MAEDPRFLLHFKTLAKFKEKLADGTISENRHLVFIKDEKLVWCRGVYYADASKLDNFNSYYNDWSVAQSDANTITITLKGNQWNSTTRKWEAISKPLTLNAATGSIAGLMSAQDKRQLDIINTANFELTAPTTTATNVILHTKRTNVNTETNNIADSETVTVRTLPAVTQSTAGVMIAADKLAIDNLKSLGSFSHINDSSTFSRTATNVNLNYSCKSVDNVSSDAPTVHSQPIGAASSTLAGVMIASDKVYLDSLHTATVGSATRPVYINAGTITAGTYSFGNASGNAPISNGTVNTNLNADLLDGLHHSAFARADQDPVVDLNNVNGKGIMTNTANANATTARHYPIAEAGTLFYGTAAYSSANQIYGTYNTNRWFVRGGGGSATTKTDWKELLHTGNYSTTLDGRYYTESEIDSKISTINSTISTNKSTMDSHISNKSNPHAVTKAQVGLGNVTNESKATMFTSPTFTGTPTAPTAAASTNTTQVATTAFVQSAINAKAYSLPLAANGTRGGVQVGYSTNGKNYAVQLSGEKMYVNVPWTDTNTTYSNATQSSSGLMSSTDKAKLDGIASSANNYSLPLMTSSVRGGAKIGFTTNATNRNYAVQLSNEQMYVNVPWTNTTYSNASSSAAGLMSATDKAKLDGIASGANAYSLPLASSSTRGGVKIGYTANGKNYPVQLSDEKMYVNVPWTDTNTNTTYSAGDGLSLSSTTFSINFGRANTWTGYQNFTGGAGNSSDIRFKTNIVPVNNVLDKILKLDIFNYIWNKAGEPEENTFGVSAQQLEELGNEFAKLVHIRDDEDKTRSVEYNKLSVLAIKAIQELYKEIVELKKVSK